MKKLKLILIPLLLLVLCACGKSSNLKSLSLSELKEKMNNKETFFFVVEKDGCQYCEAYVPKVEEVLDEYDIIGYVINISDMSASEYEEFDKLFAIDGTPTTIFMTEGNELSILQRIDGNVSKDKIISKLENNNYIKK